MSVPMSRSAPGPFNIRPIRLSSLQPLSEARPIQPTPEDGPPSGHPHLGGRAPATFDPAPNLRGMPPEQRTQYALQRPGEGPARQEVPAPEATQPPPLTTQPWQPIESPADPHTAAQDPFDAPPAKSPSPSIYEGIVDDAAEQGAATPKPVSQNEQPVAVASRPVSQVAVAGSAVQDARPAADIEIEVRGRPGSRVVTIRLRG